MQTISDFTFEQALDYFGKNVSAMVIADENADVDGEHTGTTL